MTWERKSERGRKAKEQAPKGIDTRNGEGAPDRLMHLRRSRQWSPVVLTGYGTGCASFAE
jgi:hypothetical protein